ncbi:hypothetical protein [Bradyrhizobium ivorense]|uniref:hypothetical protein n=1 Tax=Bradyrhizobium ivorense TaxID=2511166 RepID=UPI00111EFFD0|nr:hypothetical protein [Bradyrhizobium ivorense]
MAKPKSSRVLLRSTTRPSGFLSIRRRGKKTRISPGSARLLGLSYQYNCCLQFFAGVLAAIIAQQSLQLFLFKQAENRPVFFPGSAVPQTAVHLRRVGDQVFVLPGRSRLTSPRRRSAFFFGMTTGILADFR